MIRSKALEANIADYSVEVEIDPKYEVLREAMSGYFGILEGLNTFLEELSHPFRNWRFIVGEARGYALDYFHLLKKHPKGRDAAQLLIEIFISAVEEGETVTEVKSDAVDNLLLYLQKIIRDSGKEIEQFLPVVDDACARMLGFDDDCFFLVVKSYYQLPRVAVALADARRKHAPDSCGSGYETVSRLLMNYFRRTCDYWLNEEDPGKWFEKESGVDDGHRASFFDKISHAEIKKQANRLAVISDRESPDSEDTLRALLELPGYGNFVNTYKGMPARLLASEKDDSRGNQLKVIFLFRIMNISGLSVIHGEALRDINRTVTWLIGNETHLYIENLIRKTFSILKARSGEFPATALNVILNMGKGIYNTDDGDLINLFVDSAVDMGFHSPMVRGVGDDWQIQGNPFHVQNIRTWLELIGVNPKLSSRLLSYLIIHLSITGVFIKDTDLFPRDITNLLNSKIEPVYNLVKQLAKLFPVFFNDIGAEGRLRDNSTRLDEICHRKDRLVHYLRKQTHVESNNRIIDFMETVFAFWENRDKTLLEEHVPPEIYGEIESTGPFVDGVHRVLAHLGTSGLAVPEDFLSVKEEKLERLFESVSIIPGSITPEDIERVRLAASLYKMFRQKYDLAGSFKTEEELENYIAQLQSEFTGDLKGLKSILAGKDLKKRIFDLLEFLEKLREKILSPEQYEIREDIYKKRHFAFDIPSMYGRYNEEKFDALGLTFRIESLINVYFEEIVDDIDLSLITRATFFSIFDKLVLFDKALKLDGIASVEIESQLDLLAHSLEASGFTFTQYLDIFKGFARAVKNIINDYFHNIHETNLTKILSKLPAEVILPKYRLNCDAGDSENFAHKVSEMFFREKLSLSLGLPQLDLFLTRILKTLFRQSHMLPDDKLHLLLNYDPYRAMMPINDPNSQTTAIIYLGNKGFNLVKLNNFGYPVPPGFIITTEVFRSQEIIDDFPPAQQNFKEQVSRHISDMTKLTGRAFGNPENPLLFSIRSGSSISQPGMMNTFLNVGINEAVTEGLAKRTKNSWFAWDNYRRFLQCWGMSWGIERDDFDEIISEYKRKYGIPLKRIFSGEQMRHVALNYKKRIMDEGVEIPDNPFQQLLLTIKKVLESWESVKAKAYRRIMGISDDWGTAVTVQSMVYGNISSQSGSGVFFTHNPKLSGDTLRLWGDFTLGNQGEDVVSGLVTTLPISVRQQDIEMRETNITLESNFPNIYNNLRKWANELIYNKGWSPQEMEFTFESPSAKDLYVLQTRTMAIRATKRVIRFAPESMARKQIMGNGIGVSGGAMSGRVVFTLEDIDRWRYHEPESSLILLRGDTVPDDIREIHAADGLLTARGGVTSHASVVAHRLGKTCVVGCANLVCDEKNKKGRFDDVLLKSGDFISIDGQEGSVYQGYMDVTEE